MVLTLLTLDAHETREVRAALSASAKALRATLGIDSTGAGFLYAPEIYSTLGPANLATFTYVHDLGLAETEEPLRRVAGVERIHAVGVEGWPGRGVSDAPRQPYALFSLLKLSDRLLLADSFYLLDAVVRRIACLGETINAETGAASLELECYLSLGWEDVLLVARGCAYTRIDRLLREVRAISINDVVSETGPTAWGGECGPQIGVVCPGADAPIIPLNSREDGASRVRSGPVFDSTHSIVGVLHEAWDVLEQAALGTIIPGDAEQCALNAELRKLRDLAKMSAPNPTLFSKANIVAPDGEEHVLAQCAVVVPPLAEQVTRLAGEAAFVAMCPEPACGAYPLPRDVMDTETLPGRVDLLLWRPVHSLPLLRYLTRLVLLECALYGRQGVLEPAAGGAATAVPFPALAALGVQSTQSTLIVPRAQDPSSWDERAASAARVSRLPSLVARPYDLRALRLSEVNRPGCDDGPLTIEKILDEERVRRHLTATVRGALIQVFAHFDAALGQSPVGAAVLDLYPVLLGVRRILLMLGDGSSEGGDRVGLRLNWLPDPYWSGGGGLLHPLPGTHLSELMSMIVGALDLALKQHLRHRTSLTGTADSSIKLRYGPQKVSLGIGTLFAAAAGHRFERPESVRPIGVCIADVARREVEVLRSPIGLVRVPPITYEQPELLVEILHELAHRELDAPHHEWMRAAIRDRFRQLPPHCFPGGALVEAISMGEDLVPPISSAEAGERRELWLYREIFCDSVMASELRLTSATVFARILFGLAERTRSITRGEMDQYRMRLLAAVLVLDLRAPAGGRNVVDSRLGDPFERLADLEAEDFLDQVHARLVRPLMERLFKDGGQAGGGGRLYLMAKRILSPYVLSLRELLASSDKSSRGWALSLALNDRLFLRRLSIVLDRDVLRHAHVVAGVSPLGEVLSGRDAVRSPTRSRQGGAANWEGVQEGRPDNLHWGDPDGTGEGTFQDRITTPLSVPGSVERMYEHFRTLWAFLDEHAAEPRVDLPGDRWVFKDRDRQGELFRRRSALLLTLWHASVGYREEILRRVHLQQEGGDLVPRLMDPAMGPRLWFDVVRAPAPPGGERRRSPRAGRRARGV